MHPGTHTPVEPVPVTFDVDHSEPLWIPADAWAARGLHEHGPEMDFGLRWGPGHDIRVSYAPYRHPAHAGRGFLYAHQPSTDRYTMLHRDTTAEHVDTAWTAAIRTRAAGTELTDFLAFGQSVDAAGPRTPTDRAQATMLRCLRNELDSRAQLAATGPGLPLDLARQAVIARSARMASEDILRRTVRTELGPGHPLVTIGYRIPGRPPIHGTITALDVDAAYTAVRDVRQLAGQHHLQAHVTSLEHGRQTLPLDAENGARVTTQPVHLHTPGL
jgi:hypothetical protein